MFVILTLFHFAMKMTAECRATERSEQTLTSLHFQEQIINDQHWESSEFPTFPYSKVLYIFFNVLYIAQYHTYSDDMKMGTLSFSLDSENPTLRAGLMSLNSTNPLHVLQFSSRDSFAYSNLCRRALSYGTIRYFKWTFLTDYSSWKESFRIASKQGPM